MSEHDKDDRPLDDDTPRDDESPEQPEDNLPEGADDFAQHFGSGETDTSELEDEGLPPEEAAAAMAQHFGGDYAPAEDEPLDPDAVTGLAEHFGHKDEPALPQDAEAEAADPSELGEHFGKVDESMPDEPVVVGPKRHSFLKIMLWSLPTLTIGVLAVLMYKGYINVPRMWATHQARNAAPAAAAESMDKLVKDGQWSAICSVMEMDKSMFSFAIRHVDGDLVPGQKVKFRIVLTNKGDRNLWLTTKSYYDLSIWDPDRERFRDIPEFDLRWTPPDTTEAVTLEIKGNPSQELRPVAPGEVVEGRVCEAEVIESGKLTVRIEQNVYLPHPDHDRAFEWDYEDKFVKQDLVLEKKAGE